MPARSEAWATQPSPTSTVDVLTTIDSLGRLSMTENRTAPNANTFDNVVKYGYGWNSTGAFSTQTIPSGTAVTTTQFDALGRTASVTDGGSGTLSMSYAQNDVLRTVGPAPAGEHTKSRQLESDGLGRLTSVCEILTSGGTSCGQNTAASGYKTSYAYTVPTAGGSQTTVTQGSQTRTFVSDGLSRVISETNPESATTTYKYDSGASSACVTGYSSAGDLLQKIDANGISVCYYYDALHRLTDVGTNQTGGYCRRFRFDNSTGVTGTIPSGVTITNSMGRLVEAETDNCTQPVTPITDEWFSYDADGNQTDVYELTPHSGGYYHTSAAYFANGALQSLGGVPGYTTLTYGVDGEGRLSSAQQGTQKIVCDASCSNASATFYPGGQPHVVAIGGTSDNDTYAYDANTGRMNTYTFTVGSTPKSIGGTLTWNSNGSLRSLAITDGFNSGGAETCNYGTSTVMGYDDLGRLLSANCGSNWAQTFSYDQFGNITKSGSLTWACPACYNSNNQYNSTLSPSISYDADGNLLDDTFYKYTWDAYGYLATISSTTGSVTCGTSGTCLTHDANGQMVEKNVAGVYTEVLYSPVGKTAIMSGQTTSSAYFPLPAGATVYETGSTGGNQYFWHKDWLGSVRFASTISNRGSYYDRGYAPFGETYSNFGNTSGLDFTGDTQDTASGLYDTPNREQNPNQGRWISPDPAGVGAVDFANPQTWNRYAYVVNNPLSNIDPSGLACFPLFEGDCNTSGLQGNDAWTGKACDPTIEASCIFMPFTPFAGVGQGRGNNDGSSFDFSFDLSIDGLGCGADFMPCALGPLATSPGQALSNLWSVLGLPTGLNCPKIGGVLSPLCGGFNPIMDATQQPCYGSNSLTDKAVRTFSLLRLPETWEEWVVGGAAKLSFFGVMQAGAKSAGGANSLGSAAIGTGGKILGYAGSAATIVATMADINCQIGPVDPYTEK